MCVLGVAKMRESVSRFHSIPSLLEENSLLHRFEGLGRSLAEVDPRWVPILCETYQPRPTFNLVGRLSYCVLEFEEKL